MVAQAPDVPRLGPEPHGDGGVHDQDVLSHPQHQYS